MTSNLVPLIKRAALEAVAASKPMSILCGEVASTEPLQILIDQRFMLSEEFIIVPQRFSNHTVTGTLNSGSEQAQSVQIAFDNALKMGDPVLMLMMQGGQRYIVLERGMVL